MKSFEARTAIYTRLTELFNRVRYKNAASSDLYPIINYQIKEYTKVVENGIFVCDLLITVTENKYNTDNIIQISDNLINELDNTTVNYLNTSCKIFFASRDEIEENESISNVTLLFTCKIL